jgi:GH25 family lysozyme M1 (1,4-beta-N-acetylmuramidase)
MIELHYGNDTSKWQLAYPYKIPPKFNLAAERKIDLVCVKKSQGCSQDPAFGITWNTLKQYPIKRTVYHYFEPVVSFQQQIDALLSGLVPEDIQAPMWLDVEKAHSLPKSGVLNRMIEMLYAMKEWSRRPVAIYTSKAKFDTYYSRLPGWGNDWLLVVANYGPPYPLLPTGWTDWDGWQFSADGNGLGRFFGYASGSVDMDLLKPILLGE